MKENTHKLTLCKWPAIVALVWFALNVTACEVLGPKTLKAGRNQYNEAINRTSAEELLLNIVRLRFNEQPYFLEVASISSAAEIAATLGARFYGSGQERGPDASISYLERPTIIYQPLTGDKFVGQLLTPLDLKTLLLLRGAGWELDDILQVFVNRMNGVPNAPTGADSTPEGIPVYKQFDEIVEALDELEDAGSITLAANEENEDELVVIVSKWGRGSKNYVNFVRALNLNAELDRYRMRIGLTGGGDNEIAVDTRPIMAAMFYLGQGIKIPEEFLNAGYVHFNKDEKGQPFDWNKVLHDIFVVHSSREEPAAAYAAVRYRSYWYYIDIGDINTRETLTMLSIVLTLKAGGIPSKAPILTIPVGGGG